ncbi:hypothetical protein VIBNISFn118_610058 [Vibrio nigripulchritudo SFn118]|nr:hypothetical protein VIBNISFn118_610058 [Vibrio nigripulchritudo SFn118]
MRTFTNSILNSPLNVHVNIITNKNITSQELIVHKISKTRAYRPIEKGAKQET